jgi:isoleucyl-tRNA synthetase
MLQPFSDESDDAKLEPREIMAKIWPLVKSIYEAQLMYPLIQLQPKCNRCDSAPLLQLMKKWPMIASYATLEQDPSLVLLVWTEFPALMLCNYVLCVDNKVQYIVFRFEGGDEKWKYLMKRDSSFAGLTNGKIVILETVSGQSLVGLKYKPLWMNGVEPDCELLRICAMENMPVGLSAFGYATGIISVCPFLFDHKNYVKCLPKFDFSGIARASPVLDRDGVITTDTYPVNFKGISMYEVGAKMVEEVTQAGMVMTGIETFIKRGTGRVEFCGACGNFVEFYHFSSSWFLKSAKFKQDLVDYLENCRWNTKLRYSFLNDGNLLRDSRVSSTTASTVPLPIWSTPDGKECLVVGSVEELLLLASDARVDVDAESLLSDLVKVKIPSRQEKGM